MYLLVRAVSELIKRVNGRMRWLLANATIFFWFRSLPWSTIVYGRIHVPHIPCRITVGSGCSFGRDVFVSTGRMALIELEEKVSINAGSMLVASKHIRIGRGTAIAEYVSIRDQAHNFDVSVGIHDLGFKVEPVIIGRNVWIGKGVLIGPGAKIGDGCIVGANSVVHGTFPPGVLIAGAPAVIKKAL
jgi:UDP-3-O-[3-hydroxymyristoyl] glucosamine N-acyltransferase